MKIKFIERYADTGFPKLDLNKYLEQRMEMLEKKKCRSIQTITINEN